MPVSIKPDVPSDFSFTTADGHPVAFHRDKRIAGVWMSLPGAGKSLMLCSENRGSAVWNYVAYRDSNTGADRLAILANPDGTVTIQVILPGDPMQGGGARQFSLDRLDEMVRQMRPDPV